VAEQQVADGARRLARVGDVIEHGQDIPANVRQICDRYESIWYRNPIGHFHLDPDDDPATCGDNCMTGEHILAAYGPMTVVEVDPEPQPAEDNEPEGAASDAEVLQLIDERDDAHEWADRLAQAIAEFLHIDIGEHSNYNLPWQAALIALTDTVSPQPAESGPLVLTLPVVPDEAVALIGETTGKRFTRELTGAWRDVATAQIMPLWRVLEREGSVTVEMAPPREPRTWAPIETEDDDPDVVDVYGRDATLPPERWHRMAGSAFYEREGCADRTLAGLRELGKVREVLT
jgi:hypothetical protein